MTKTTNATPLNVFRSTKTDGSHFARIDNAVLQSGKLSLRARGLLAFVLSMPADWRHSAESLSNPHERKHAIRAAIKELVTAGHARLVKDRMPDGRVRHRWQFSELPDLRQPSSDFQHSAPSSGFQHSAPSSDLPATAQPSDGGPALFKTTIDQTTIQSLAPAPADAGKCLQAVLIQTDGQDAPESMEAPKESKPRAVPVEIEPHRKGRQRNPCLDALAALDGSDLAQVTDSAWGAAAKALKDIRAVFPNVDADEIRRRAECYRRKHPTWPLTPNALAKNWASLAATTPAEPALKQV